MERMRLINKVSYPPEYGILCVTGYRCLRKRTGDDEKWYMISL